MKKYIDFQRLNVIVLLISGCLFLVNCSKNDDSDIQINPKLTFPQTELFPGLVKEEWYFFNPDQTYHHYEVFQYHYDNNGIRDSGTFWQAEWNNFLNLKYQYDAKGRLIKENWTNPYMTSIFWNIVYNYDPTNSWILGGHGEGYYTWDFSLTYDDKGRRASTTFTAPASEWMAPKFTVFHQYNDENICIMATGTEQRGMSIVIVYTYANGISGTKKASLYLKNVTTKDKELIYKRSIEIFNQHL